MLTQHGNHHIDEIAEGREFDVMLGLFVFLIFKYYYNARIIKKEPLRTQNLNVHLKVSSNFFYCLVWELAANSGI